MNGRERFQRVLRYQPVDRVPNFEVGVMRETLTAWLAQGMPKNTGITRKSIITFNGNDFFGQDRQMCLGVNLGLIPRFSRRILQDDGRLITVRTPSGIVVRAMRDNSCMPQYLTWPVRNRQDFESIRKRHNPLSPKRYPSDWPDVVAKAAAADCPVWGPGVGSIGFFSRIRDWMGTENACTIFYDDPALAHEMCGFIADFALETLKKALAEARMDYFSWWEDFSFKTGPLISPATFKEFLAPHYRRVNDALRRAGVNNILLDTDGDPRVMLRPLLDVGVNGTCPMEQCNPSMSPVALRREFGRELWLLGGIDKRILALDRKAIDRELESKLPPLLAEGGYIPTLDHLAQPEIPYANWLYYLERKKRLLEGKG